MKTTMKTILIASLLMGSAFGQLNTLVQTSLSAAITQNQTVFSVGSATGIVAPTNAVAGSALYVVDVGQVLGELMNVQSISGTSLTVSRTGSRAKPHLSGAMVLVATAPNWFQTKDPSGSCVTASTYVTPYLNINTGAQWLCSAKTLAWIPSWGNPLSAIQGQVNDASATASVGGTTAISGPVTHISGTNAITAFGMPIGWQGNAFCIIPDAAYTTTTGGTTVASTRVMAIGAASTAVQKRTRPSAISTTRLTPK